MISYKYKLYRTKKTKHLDKMLREACYVWNHALALQKRYYKLYHKYIPRFTMYKHFSKCYKPTLLNCQTVREVLDRLDISYKRFFKHDAKRPPKFKKAIEFGSFAFQQNGYSLSGNEFVINKIKKSFKFSLSRPYDGKVKRVSVKRNKLGEYFIVLCLDKQAESYGKSHDGASVGIDFGLKKYMTLSDGREIDNPQFLKTDLLELRRRSRNLSKCKKGSNNRKRKKLELERLYQNIVNKRSDFQWKMAHELCKRYDLICLEDLNLEGMKRNWGRKMSDLAHGDFVLKLEHVAKNMAFRFIRLTDSSLRAAFVLVVIRMISCHWVIGFGLVLFVVQSILETSSQLRIYFGRALPNWVVVVSRPSNRKGAATLVTQQFLASSEGVCHQTRSLGRC